MNILIPHQWLLEQLETSAKPEELQKLVSLCGPSVERIYDREGDKVYDIEVTTNRVDSMSVRGIAREAAVILSRAGMPSKLKALELPSIPQPKGGSLPFPKVTIKTPACKRTLGVILDNVAHAATPEWMGKRLQQVEQNVHDAVIDITNYITHELGHPCHAFDYDKLMKLGGEIIITEAEAGLTFTTLDGESYKTVGGEVVFLNPAGEIIDLPAIKGTANSSIDNDTKRVLLWIESLEAEKVRFASMTHAIRTVAAQLNEKHVDPMLAMPVLERGVELYGEICGASVESPIHDTFPQPPKAASIIVPQTEVERYLGITLTEQEIVTILTDLECDVTWGTDSFMVIPPSFRPDLTIPADVIEELARIYGYHNVPSVLMTGTIPTNKPTDTNYAIENAIKNFLAAIGWQEVYTYSMVSEELALKSGFSLSDHVKLQNPLTDDRVYMRRSLLPSLEEVLDTNSQNELSVFELAMLYEPVAHDIPKQTLNLSMVSSGEYRNVKGDVEALLQRFFVTPQFHVSEPQAQFSQMASITVDDTKIGKIGVLKSGKVAVGISMAAFLTVAKTHPTYQPIPKTSYIIEDLTFTIPPKTEIGPLLSAWKQHSELVKNVDVSSVYQQNVTLTVTYWHPEKTLSAEEVTPLRKELVELAAKTVNGTLVGQLN